MIIIGNGGFADEVKSIAELVGFTVAGMLGPGRDKCMDPGVKLACGIGTPRVKAEVLKQYEAHVFPVLQHFSASVASADIGKGCVIAAGARLTTGIRTGDFCLFNLNCTVGHNVLIGRCVSIMPGANVGGECVIEDNVLIGAGASLFPGIRVGDGAIVGMGAVVMSDVEPGATVIGNPAVRIR